MRTLLQNVAFLLYLARRIVIFSYIAFALRKLRFGKRLLIGSFDQMRHVKFVLRDTNDD